MLLFIITTIPIVSQSHKQVFDCKQIVFFGIDFSMASMIGPADFKSGEEIRNTYFEAWNNILFSERKRYNLIKTFGKDSVDYDFSIVKERNKLPSPEKIVTEVSSKISTDDIIKIISTYKTESYKDGTGLVFIVESFSKPDQKGNFYVVFFDIETKKVLLCEKLSEKPGGFGLRNYWIRTIYNGLDDIEDDLWDSWKEKYSH